MSATNVVSGIFPLGYIAPGASFASLSKAITANYTDLATSTLYGLASIVTIHMVTSSSGTTYVCNTADPPDTTNYVNVLDVLTGGQTRTYSAPSTMNELALANLYIGASDGTTGAMVSVQWR